MLEKPNLQDEQFVACLKEEYGLHATQFEFMPLGANTHAAVYRAITEDGTPYFVKLRRGEFDELTVELPKFLSEQGIAEIIAPLETRTGQLRAELDEFKVIVYPFIEGKSAYEQALTDGQWKEFGAAFRKIHTVELPEAIKGKMRRETYSAEVRDEVREVLEHVRDAKYEDAIAANAARFVDEHRADVRALIEHAEKLAKVMQAQPRPFVLSHTDIHAGNVHITPEGKIYIVDWDAPMLAPRERDLMFIGGGQGFSAENGGDEEELFYRGYGETEMDWGALAYFRFERMVMDIAVECERMFSGKLNAKDQADSYNYLTWNWLPGFPIERSYKAYEMYRASGV